MASVLLLVLLIGLSLIFVYYFNDGDLLSPPCLACIAFLASGVAAIYLCFAWDTSIDISTVLTIVVGLAVFVAASSVSPRASETRRFDPAPPVGQLGLSVIGVNRVLLGTVCIAGCLISVLYVRELLSIADYSGDFTDAMTTYRYKAAYGDAEDIAIPSWINYGFRLFMAFAYAYTFVFINNLVAARKRNWLCLLPGLVYCAASLAQAARGQIVVYLFATVVCVWIVKQKITLGGFRVPFWAVPAALVFLVVAGVVFLAAGDFIGRTTVKTPFDSLMTYIGGSIIGLDLYLGNPSAATSPGDIIGSETFRGLYSYLGKALGISSWQYSFQMEFRYVSGVNIGNLYTAFRYYIHDFGFLGMIVLVGVQGLFFKCLYRCCIRHDGKLNLSLAIIYGYLGISIIYLPLADYLFHQYLNPTGLLTLMCFVLASWCIDPPPFLLELISRSMSRRSSPPSTRGYKSSSRKNTKPDSANSPLTVPQAERGKLSGSRN